MAKITHKPLPPLELLQQLFKISETSPSGLRWKISRATNVKSGQVAGSRLKHGYWEVAITDGVKKRYLVHRVAYYLQTGTDPGLSKVDHVLGLHAPLNLRLATNTENSANSKKRKTTAGIKCSSKFKGVYWNKERQKWRARINYQGKEIHLGRFTDEIEAATAYNKAAIEYFGEFAKINKVEE
jgi:hypothetical protein